MDREFVDLYNTELQLLHEQAAEFAEEYPGIAERLGGLLADRMDPMVGGLLEGAAFLAARVQLKLRHEFPQFTNNLIEQIVPHYLAPTPSVLLLRLAPPYGEPALRDGHRIGRGAYLDATYRELDRQIACRFRLAADVVLWPFEIRGAEYFSSPAPLSALGLSPASGVSAGLRLCLVQRGSAREEDEAPDAEAAKRPELWLSSCRVDELTFYLTGSEADAVALYEQTFARLEAVHLRYHDRFGDPVVIRLPPGSVAQIGFGEDERLFPADDRIFSGFELLREYFAFPRKFLGFRLAGLKRHLASVQARSVDILFTFTELNARLAAAVAPGMFTLYAVPAVNLFEKTCDRIPVRSTEHEHHVVPDRNHALDFEPHRLVEVYAHYGGGREKVPVRPLYSADLDGPATGPDLSYTVRRLPRRRSVEERRYGSASTYTGTDMFLSFSEPAGISDDRRVTELSVRALCSNRHLTEHLPVGQGGADFHLLDNIALDLFCVAGPTRPREPVISHLRSRAEIAHAGTVAWRLINMLSLNHLGLVERGAGRNAEALREILSMFADLSDSATERRIRGVRLVDSRPVIRRIRQSGGAGAGRGVEITVTVDERAFEGTGAFLLGAVLDRFFSEYASFNHFTETVIRSDERGELMRWPVRGGARRPL